MKNLAEKLQEVLSEGVKNGAIEKFEINKSELLEGYFNLGISFKNLERWHWLEFNTESDYIIFKYSYKNNNSR